MAADPKEKWHCYIVIVIFIVIVDELQLLP